MNSLASKLLTYRLAVGLGQAEAARQAGIDKSTLSRIEIQGRQARIPSWNVIETLGAIYGLNADQVAELQQMRVMALRTP